METVCVQQRYLISHRNKVNCPGNSGVKLFFIGREGTYTALEEFMSGLTFTEVQYVGEALVEKSAFFNLFF